jgi:hypothetical protein
LGNYSFFVRPGYKRIQLTGAADLATLMGTAYVAPDSTKIVAVYVNMSSTSKKLRTTVSNLGNYTPVTNKMYITSSSYNLQKYGSASSETYTADRELTIPARSVATVVYEMQLPPTSITLPEKNPLTLYPNPVAAGEQLSVYLPQDVSEQFTLSVYSVQGNLIFNKNNNSCENGVITFCTENLVQGVYFIKIESNSKIFNGKIIIH